MDKILVKKAFISSLPVLMGYTTMGFAAGVLLAAGSGLEHPVFWGFLTSLTSISGALQFMLVGWMRSPKSLIDIALLTICLNIRYAMYGLSLIERFRGTGFLKKAYLVWTLTDETYALEVENGTPPGKDSTTYCVLLAAMNHSYWVLGVCSGALFGKVLPFQNKGIDFAMTALFLVILTDQMKEKSNRAPALAGTGATIAGFLFSGADKMLIPSMLLMIGIFLVFRKKFEQEKSR